jgi:hypothetical protein
MQEAPTTPTLLRTTKQAASSSVGARWAKWLWLIGLCGAIVVGAGLRLIWGKDIEYKGDEAWTFERTQAVGHTEPFPWVGMQSSAAVPNPGMSVWVFLVLGKLFQAQDPAALARTVQVVNIAALVLLVVFALRVVPPRDREIWLWAAALVALNPFAVLFQRKIWPPSVLPLFTVIMLAGWWYRRRRWGAFTWGLVGACVGQIHMSGFIFAGAFAGWTVLFHRRRVAWGSWLAGNLIGAIPLAPWLISLMATAGDGAGASTEFTHILEARFWSRWVTEPFGLGLRYSLGKDFADFLRYPVLGGHATYLVALLHGCLLVAAVVLLARAAARLWTERCHLRVLWIGKHSPTAFVQNAALWGFGILVTASTLMCQRHYLIITFPLMFVWVARLALVHPGGFPRSDERGCLRRGRNLLATLCVAQGLLTFQFLGYIHANQRAIAGDYGTPLKAQGAPSPKF